MGDSKHSPCPTSTSLISLFFLSFFSFSLIPEEPTSSTMESKAAQSDDRFGSSGGSATMRFRKQLSRSPKPASAGDILQFSYTTREQTRQIPKPQGHQTTLGAFSATFSQPLHCFPNPSLAPFGNFALTWLLLAFTFIFCRLQSTRGLLYPFSIL